jgi:molybdate/tungstate transport system substrate-binding protein
MSGRLTRTAVLATAVAWLSILGAESTAYSQATLPAPAAQPTASAEVIVYHAGSLNAMFDQQAAAFLKASGIRVTHRGMGAVEAARRATVGKEPCDIYAGADYVIIDAWLKPTYADHTIAFGQSAMVLTYTTTSKNAASIADPAGPPFAPPGSVPNAAPKWYAALTQPGVRIGGSDPSLDPGGYRALMVLQLAQSFYRLPTLYQDLLKNHAVNGPKDRLGETVDYQFAYEHSAKASAARDPNFRYVKLPPEIDLSSPAHATRYNQAVVPITGFTPTDPAFPMRGTRALFGLTLLKNAPNREAAVRFLEFMLSTRPGEGGAIQAASGPDLIAPNGPAAVSREDYARLPAALAPLVKIGL